MAYMIACIALAALGLEMILGAAYLLRRAKRLEETLDVMLNGVDVLLKRQRRDRERLEGRLDDLSKSVEGRGERDEIPAALRSLDDRGKFLAEGIERCSGKLNTVLEVALRADDRIRGASADMGKDLKELRCGVRSLEDQGKGFAEAAEELRKGVKLLMDWDEIAGDSLERMEKLLSDRGGPADRAGSSGQAAPAGGGGSAEAVLPAERESELSREMEEGVMNLLRYAAGKAPGVEVSV